MDKMIDTSDRLDALYDAACDTVAKLFTLETDHTTDDVVLLTDKDFERAHFGIQVIDRWFARREFNEKQEFIRREADRQHEERQVEHHNHAILNIGETKWVTCYYCQFSEKLDAPAHDTP